jgi:transcriptional regulator with XRE-family HTH domain
MTESIDFAMWLQHKLDTKGWKASDLARESGLDDGYLSRILKRERRRPGIEACKKIAGAFGLDDEEVLIAAGFEIQKRSIASPHYPRMVKEMIAEYLILTDDEKTHVLNEVRGLNTLKGKMSTKG